MVTLKLIHGLGIGVMFATVLAATGCGRAPSTTSHTSDLATDKASVYLYYIEGRDLVRARCQENNPLRDRATCREGRQTVNFDLFRERLERGVGSAIPAIEQRTGLLYTKLERLETMLIELVSTEGHDPAAVDAIRKQLRQAEEALNDLVARLKDFEDQAARIQRQLETTADPDLAAQLTALRVKIEDTRKQIDAAKAATAAAREKFIEDHARLLSSDIFRSLTAQRAAVAAEIVVERSNMQRELATVANVRLLEHMISSPNSTYEVITNVVGFDDLKPIAARMHAIFNNILVDAKRALINQASAQVGTLMRQRDALLGQYAYDMSLRRGLESAASGVIADSVSVAVTASANPNAPGGCSSSTNGSWVEQLPYPVWYPRDLSPALYGDALIDKFIETIYEWRGGGLARWDSAGSCQRDLASGDAWDVRVYAGLVIRQKYEIAGSCSSFSVTAAALSGASCSALLSAKTGYEAYRKAGGHQHYREIAALNAENTRKAAEFDTQIAPLQRQIAAWQAEIEAIQKT